MKVLFGTGEKVYIGVDPGWKNLGFAVSAYNTKTNRIRKIYTHTYNPSSYKNINAFIAALDYDLDKLTSIINCVTIERYVAYEGVHTAENENINLVIGALIHYFGGFTGQWEVEPLLVRAIDWKMKLVKALFKKKGFRNPSESLDKKFSDAAAIAVMDEDENGTIDKLSTNHESDALCLSVLPVYIG